MTDFPFWLNDEQWAAISSHLPVNQPGPRRISDRIILSGIVFILITGRPWRDCPPQYGSYMTVFNRYNRWKNRELWRRIVGELRNFGIDLGSAMQPDASLTRKQHTSSLVEKLSRKQFIAVRSTGLGKLDSRSGSQTRPVALPMGEMIGRRERSRTHRSAAERVTPAQTAPDARLLRQFKDSIFNYVSGLINLNHKLLTALEAMEKSLAEEGRISETVASSPKRQAKPARVSARASL